MSTAIHVPWGSIELFHNVVRTLAFLKTSPTVTYRAKVKLHGTNCAIQTATGGNFTAQSRTTILTPQDDLKGFAKWVEIHAAYFATMPENLVIFGEWCGPGIEKGMAISAVKTKIFAVFAVYVSGIQVSDPDEIRAILPTEGAPGELHILPWTEDTIVIDYSSKLEEIVDRLNALVVDVESEDPWVKTTFGISGVGEGLVFYPVLVDQAPPPSDPVALMQLMFKAKGDKHRTVGAKVAVQIDADVAASADDFAELMVTEARCQQGISIVGRGAKNTGKFIAWISDDVLKESVAELAASDLTWDQVKKAVQTRSRTWFLQEGT